jgi:TonB-dependent receptor
MKPRSSVPQQRRLTVALMLALAQPGLLLAQQSEEEAKPAEETEEKAMDTIVVTGIRQSFVSSMNVKRDAQGVVDGIVSEDIGKFPDTNLAESLQRISGVSIDRVNGEGSRVTVRGVGPDFNLVLLNGRQMPASSIADTGASNSRAFDFGNLASEAVAAVDVYKTSRASSPTGGIGATINIKTTRPLDAPGFTANLGLKAVHDTSADNLPDALQGSSVTPEISGIYSQTFADDRFGIALTGSYQERDFGYSQAATPNGWRTFRGDENNWGTIPQPGTPGSENITNRPRAGDIYSVPQNLLYSVNGISRERTNGQLTLQFRPSDNITTTLDYTYSEQKIQSQRNELSVWFNFGPSRSAWTNGPVAAPLLYSEIISPANSDLSMGGAMNATRNENKSLGFNVAWDVNDSLKLALDYHDSRATSGADSPFGSSGVLGAAGFFRGTTTVDYSGDFPVLTVQLPPGVSQIDPAGMLVTGSTFRNSYMKSEVEQLQATGSFEFEDYSKLDFGVSATDVHNRSAFSNVQLDSWGGATSPADYPNSVWRPDRMGRYFNQFPGHNAAGFTDAFFTWDFATVRQLAAEAWARRGNNPNDYLASNEFSTDRRVLEESRSAFLQWSTTLDLAMPLNIAAGVRYEQTDVVSSALVPVATGISWGSANELSILRGAQGFTTLTGEYDYYLPNLDLSLEVTDSVILRGSYGKTIGRPGWGDIQGGQTLSDLVRVDGGTGSQGNPDLEPLVSKNFDLSAEWYYGDASYLAVGFFRKNIDNYIGVTQIVDTPFNLRTPVGGTYWQAALANGCAQADPVCIRNYIFDNFNGRPGVTRTGVDSSGNRTGTIVGQPSDPIAQFRITVPANQRSASLDGWEFNLQHMFGESGFGVSANYTIVDSGLTYDNAVIGEQFALEGLSDSANLVGFYDKGPWQLRLAYNWRDKFLAGRFDGAGPNPNYVEDYGQFDMNLSYQWNDNLVFAFEAINLTDETQRVHGRNVRQLLYATQTGPRYMLGVRYKF